MKICPKCNQTYEDSSLNYCLNDGTILNSTTQAKTEQFNQSSMPTSNNPPVVNTNFTPYQTEQQTVIKPAVPKKSNTLLWVGLIFGFLFLICGGGLVGAYVWIKNQTVSDPWTNSNVFVSNSNSQPTNSSSNNSTKESNTSTDPKELTMEKFRQIEPKITYQEAVKILGGEGDQMSSSGSGTYKTEMYKWSNSSTESIMLIFLGGKLMSKTQIGLSKNINSSITIEKYNQLKDGMKYDEVTAILGEGDEQSVTEILGVKSKTYQWKGNEFSYISATFQNEKLNSKSQYGLD